MPAILNKKQCLFMFNKVNFNRRTLLQHVDVLAKPETHSAPLEEYQCTILSQFFRIKLNYSEIISMVNCYVISLLITILFMALCQDL